MSVFTMSTIDAALVAASISEGLPISGALNAPRPSAANNLAFGTVSNMLKTLKLLIAILVFSPGAGRVRAIRRILWIMKAAMSFSGFCIVC